MNPEELNALGIRQWSVISKNFKYPNLLLGNGFSLCITDRFNYTSLFQEFINGCDAPSQVLFNAFDTANFELIQEYLSYGLKVNEALGLQTDRIVTGIERLKTGLIEVINDVHPRVAEINRPQLNSLTEQLVDQFGDIFTLNYDMFLYHIIMRSVDLYNSNVKTSAFQDYYWGPLDAESKKFMPYQNLEHYKHVYYLHGALCLFNQDILDYKILRNNADTELIEIIEGRINAGKFPLFVSEGTSQDKVNSIKRSNYLDFCLRKLKHNTNSLIIFGASMAPNDQHIIDAVNYSPRHLVYCIRSGDKTAQQLTSEKHRVAALFANSLSLEFVDSRSLLQF